MDSNHRLHWPRRANPNQLIGSRTLCGVPQGDIGRRTDGPGWADTLAGVTCRRCASMAARMRPEALAVR